MKKGFLVLMGMLLSASFVFAYESVLIDFSLLSENGDGVNRTQMDYAESAGTSYTDDQKAAMKTSLVIKNWDVVLNSSARTVASQAVSMTREATLLKDGGAANADIKKGDIVLGVRVLFPAGSYNANALIKPPFEIPAFEEIENADGNATEDENGFDTRFEGGYGIVKNVGVIKAIQLRALGRNFPHSVYIVLLDENQNEKIIPMGSLDFDGWKSLAWKNPQYVSEVRNREIRIFPMYPQSTPFYKFGGLKICRDADHVGGDFVGYFKDINIVYDKAILDDRESDVDDEDTWNIIKDREVIRKDREVRRFGNTQVLRYLEGQKKATEARFGKGDAPAFDREDAATSDDAASTVEQSESITN